MLTSFRESFSSFFAPSELGGDLGKERGEKGGRRRREKRRRIPYSTVYCPKGLNI
jgi:hypothetical protein